MLGGAPLPPQGGAGFRVAPSRTAPPPLKGLRALKKGNNTLMSAGSSAATSGGSHFQTQADGTRIRRSQRIRKEVQRYEPVIEEKKKKKVFEFSYDTTCFVCNEAVTAPRCTKADSDSDEPQPMYCEVVNGYNVMSPLYCVRCPKVYHAKCQGVMRKPKTFVRRLFGSLSREID